MTTISYSSFDGDEYGMSWDAFKQEVNSLFYEHGFEGEELDVEIQNATWRGVSGSDTKTYGKGEELLDDIADYGMDFSMEVEFANGRIVVVYNDHDNQDASFEFYK